ncbi:MAG: GNAT family N-acetyltransferase [Bacteroidales bacterium]
MIKNSGFRVRDAAVCDLPRIVEIYNTTILSREVTADTEEVSVESRVKWFEDHNSYSRPLWVIEDDNSIIIAWVSFQSFYGRPAYNATAEISIYIAPEYRGRGLGIRLLEYSVQESPKYGIKTLLAFIFSHNLPSLNLFRRLDFEQWANLPNIAELDGVERSLSILGKRVG